MHKKALIIIALLVSAVTGFMVSLIVHQQRVIEQPANPVLRTYHYPATLMKQLKGDPNAGEKIFHAFCETCHGEEPSIPVNAPRIGDKAAWQLRKKMGMPVLLKLTIRGVGAMPARGGCFECSDEQLKAAICYMLAK